MKPNSGESNNPFFWTTSCQIFESVLLTLQLMRKRQNAKCEENNLCDGVLVPSVQILREPGWRVVTCCCWRWAQHNSSYQAPSHTFCEILLNDDLFPWERPNVNYSNDLNVKCLLCSEHRLMQNANLHNCRPIHFFS